VHAAYCVLDWVGVVRPCSNGWDEELFGGEVFEALGAHQTALNLCNHLHKRYMYTSCI